MKTTTALLVLLALAFPALAMPHPCEQKVAQMKKDLDGIRGAIATFERLKPSDDQRMMLANAKEKYDRDLRRTTEAEARCQALVRAEGPGTTPPSPSEAAASAAPREAATATSTSGPPPPAAPAVVGPAVVAPAAGAVAPAVEPARPAAPLPATAAPGVSTTPATPCFTGCGKDTDCKGDRVCVSGACQDPTPR
jgi:hypothetical protein